MFTNLVILGASHYYYIVISTINHRIQPQKKLGNWTQQRTGGPHPVGISTVRVVGRVRRWFFPPKYGWKNGTGWGPSSWTLSWCKQLCHNKLVYDTQITSNNIKFRWGYVHQHSHHWFSPSCTVPPCLQIPSRHRHMPHMPHVLFSPVGSLRWSNSRSA